VLAAHVRRAQHVQRDRQQLEAEEHRHQVLGRDEHDHPEHRAEQQRVVLALARLGRRLRAPRQQHRGGGRDDEDHRQRQREVVDHERARHDLGVGVPAQNDAHRRDGQDRERQRGHRVSAHEAAAQQPHEQDDAHPGGQRDQRRQRVPVDVRGLDLGDHRVAVPVTAPLTDLTAGSPAFSASWGYTANAMIASTSGTSTTASRSDISTDVTDGPARLCIARMYMRSA
jgi:hypothetical protein